LDPILLCKLGEHRYHHVRPNGTSIVFNVESLVDYILATGNFHDPTSKIPFTRKQLRELDRLAVEAKLDKASVSNLRSRHPDSGDDRRKQTDLVSNVERCLQHLVSEMMSVVETSVGRQEGEEILATSLFPQFAQLHFEFRACEPESARLMLKHFQSWIQGPPNKPTYDFEGLCSLVRRFLRSVEGMVRVEEIFEKDRLDFLYFDASQEKRRE
jgi:hypothetical protein